MGSTNINWTARRRGVPGEDPCRHGVTGEARCLDTTCPRCWESAALRFLRAAYEAPGARVSYRERGYGMGHALEAAFHLGLHFEAGDIDTFDAKLGGSNAFGASGAERYYARAIDCGNDSACRSFEAFFGRPAFVYGGKRLAVGSRVHFRGANLSVTSFGTHKDKDVLLGCSEKYVSGVEHGDRLTSRWIKSKVRMTLDDVREAERERLAAIGRDKRVLAVAKELDHWVHKRWGDNGGVQGLIAGWTEERITEAAGWCAANERALYVSGGWEKAVADAPAFIRDLISGYLEERRRYEATRELQEALWSRNYKHGSSFDYEVAEEEIRARLAGDQIAGILARGTLVPCKACDGKGKLPCETCGSEYHLKCEVCGGKARVPPPPAPPSAADYKALLNTLRLRVEGGEIVGPDAPLTRAVPAPDAAPKPSALASMRAEATADMVREAKVIQSPRTKKALRNAGLVQ